MTQLALMRELLGAFSGNEMVLGVALGLWLLLMGVGTWLGRASEKLRNPLGALAVIQILVALLPLVQVFLLRTLRNVVFIRGAAVGVTETVVATLVLLLPYCVTAGYALTLACSILAREEGPSGIGHAYVADSLGSILGGILFSFVFIRFLDHIAILVCPALLNLLLAAALGHRAWRVCTVALALGVGLIAAMLLTDLDSLSTRLQYPRQHVVARGNSPYGKLIVTESDGQFDFIENGVPLTSTRDDQHVEETVHYGMAQRPDARKVLLVSGGISGTAREILKYDAAAVDYVELDPLILAFGRKYLPQSLADPRIRVINTDGRLFIQQAIVGQASRLPTGRLAREPNSAGTTAGAGETPALPPDRYDVAIIDVPAPATAQLNRFYTVEFLAEIKRVLARDGVVSLALGQYENYVSPDLARMLSSAYSSLRQTFRHVLVIPGSRVFFLASDGPLFADIAARLEQRHIQTKLVNRHYLDAMLTADRMADLAGATAQPAALNRDFSPVLYYYHLRHWMSQFNFRFGPLQVALVVLLGFYLVRLRGGAFVLFASGFAASALEIVLLLAFQVLCGSLYHQVGVIVTVFMLGLALGAWLINRLTHLAETGLVLLAWAIAAYAVLLPLALPLLNRMGGIGPSLFAIKSIIVLLTLTLALLVGMQFPLANQLEFDGTVRGASRLYTADFVGASLGALLTCILLIPTIGVTGVCLLTGALNLLGVGIIRFRKTVL